MIKLMPENEEKKFDEQLGRVDFEELERAHYRYRNIQNFAFLIIILALLGFFAWKIYHRFRQPPPEVEQTEVQNQKLWVPGVDYQPGKEEGE